MVSRRTAQLLLFVLAPLAFIAGVASLSFVDGAHPVFQFVGASVAASFIATALLMEAQQEAIDS